MNKENSTSDSLVENSASQSPEGAFKQLNRELQRAVSIEGYITPTPIQEQCIPLLLKGRDLLGQARTGTGKTAAFVLPLLDRLSTINYRQGKGTPKALILAPTRELAAQIGDSIQSYGRFLKIKHTVIFGGVKQSNQVLALNRGVDILVATPGRLMDLMQQGFIKLNEVEFFILDEVDRMLDMGFIPDIKKILGHLPKKRQTLLFSATMTPSMIALAETMVNNPAHVKIATEKSQEMEIAQKMIFLDKKNKEAALVDILKNPRVTKVIVFIQMKYAANRVVQNLEKDGIRSAAIHGNKSQAARTRALDDFKRGHFKVLVATDVAARGIDIDDISHVINYDLPIEAETYVHRIGRTARAGARGEAISFCTADERSTLRDIERLLGKTISVDSEHPYHCDRVARSSNEGGSPKSNARSRSGGSGRRPRNGGGSRAAGNFRHREKSRNPKRDN